jgi:hypothetical protein
MWINWCMLIPLPPYSRSNTVNDNQRSLDHALITKFFIGHTRVIDYGHISNKKQAKAPLVKANG